MLLCSPTTLHGGPRRVPILLPSTLNAPGGQTPSRGSGARVPPSLIKMKQTTRDDMGPGWNSTCCIYFAQFNAGPLISAVWNDVSLGRGHRWLASSAYLAQLSKFHFQIVFNLIFLLPSKLSQRKKKSNESRQFKPNPVYHYLYAKPFLWYILPLMTMECQIFPSEFTNLAIKLFQRQAY